MMRYKQNNAYQPTEELNHKNLISDTSDTQAAGNDALPKKRNMIWISISVALVIIVIAVAAVGFKYMTTPLGEPAPVEYQMYAKQLSATGILLEEGSFTFSGSLLRYPGNWKEDVVDITQLSVNGNEFTKSSMTYTVDEQTGSTVLQGHNWLIEISAQGDWCVIRTYSEYYVCSTSENFDPQDILELCTYKPV